MSSFSFPAMRHRSRRPHRREGSATRRTALISLNYAPEPTGIAPYATALARGLVDRGFEVQVVTGQPHYPEWRVAEGYGASSRTREHGTDLTRVTHSIPARPRLLSRLKMEITFGLHARSAGWKDNDSLVLVSPALVATAIVGARAKRLGIPYAVWVQDIYSLAASETGRGALAARMLRLIERHTLRSADRVVVIHDRFKTYVVDILGVPPERVSVLRNWTHVDNVPSETRAEARARLGWAGDEVIALHAGNMGAKQGLENVVYASRVAQAGGSPVRFVIMGDGNQRAALEAMGPNPHLSFIDPVDQSRFTATLAAADVLIVNERPGLTEMSVPSKLTSYFASGVPVVAATDSTSTTSDEMHLAQAGPVVDPSNPGALLDAVESLVGDQMASARFVANARRFRTEVMDARRAIDSFAELVSNVKPTAASDVLPAVVAA